MPSSPSMYRLTASLLTLGALLAGCGGGSSDSPAPPPPGPGPGPGPTPTLELSFTAPKAADNVFDANSPVYLETYLAADGNPAGNNNPVTFAAATASFAPVQAMTVGGRATTTMNASQVGPLQVQANATVSGRSTTINRTFYIRPKREPLEVLVPAYFSAGKNSEWDVMLKGVENYPGLKVTAILNPTSGIFTKTDDDFVAAMKALQQAGGKVIGYVATRYGDGERSVKAVTDNVDNYLKLYPGINGIFLDGMQNKPNRIEFYQAVYKHIKEKKDDKGVNLNLSIVGNPGTFPDAMYAGVADTLVTFEGKENAYLSVDPQPNHTWVYNKANTAQAMLVHNAISCTSMQNALKTAYLARTHAGMVYVTDLLYEYTTNTGNPWAKLPTYWNTFLGTVDALNKKQPLPNC